MNLILKTVKLWLTEDEECFLVSSISLISMTIPKEWREIDRIIRIFLIYMISTNLSPLDHFSGLHCSGDSGRKLGIEEGRNQRQISLMQ